MTTTEEKKGFMEKMADVVRPVGDFLSNEKHFASISAGLMATVGISIIAAFITIVSTVIGMFAPGTGVLATSLGWEFAGAAQVAAIINIPYTMTLGLLSVVASFAIAYNLAKYYKINQLSAGIVSMLMFLMVVAPAKTVVLADGASTFTALDTTLLGGPGLLTAIIVSLLSVEITNFCYKHGWVIKMPDVIPPFLANSFSSMVPLLLNVFIIYGINVALSVVDPSLNIAWACNAILGIPVKLLANSIPGILVINTFALLLWTTGVHGTMVVYMFLMAPMIMAITNNAALVAQGLSPVFSPVFLLGATSCVGGTGNTMGFALLCAYRAKSEQLKAVGKASIVPGLFNVNEPMTFGVPVVYNPIIAIPYILNGLILTFIMWVAYAIGFIVPGHILMLSLLPIGLAEFLGTLNWRNAIFPWLMIPFMTLIYYPFFKVYDKQLVEKEQAALAAAAE